MKTCNANITFLEVYKIYGKELVITENCLNTSTTHYYKTYPDMPIKQP